MTPYMQKKMMAMEDKIYSHIEDAIKKWDSQAKFGAISALCNFLFPTTGDLNRSISINQAIASAMRPSYTKRTVIIFGLNQNLETDARNVDDVLYPYYSMGYNIRQRLIANGLLIF